MRYPGVVEWGYPGTALHSFQCAACYQACATAAAPVVPMSMPPRTEPPPGACCSTCGGLIRSRGSG
jgi:hypothetical protein